MRKVIVGAFGSMDGVMQAPGGPEEDPTGGFKFGGWVAPQADVDPVFGEEVGKLFGELATDRQIQHEPPQPRDGVGRVGDPLVVFQKLMGVHRASASARIDFNSPRRRVVSASDAYRAANNSSGSP